MELRLKIMDGTKQISLPDALKLGKIVMGEDGLYSESAKILRATALLDENECEIFEDDNVVDEKGHSYSIIYKGGAFFAVAHNGERPKMIPLYLLQANNHVPIIISKRHQ